MPCSRVLHTREQDLITAKHDNDYQSAHYQVSQSEPGSGCVELCEEGEDLVVQDDLP